MDHNQFVSPIDGFEKFARTLLFEMYQRDVIQYKEVYRAFIYSTCFQNFSHYLNTLSGFDYKYVDVKDDIKLSDLSLRYNEIRLSDFSQEVITKDVGNYCEICNYINIDNIIEIPEYLPTKLPLMLLQCYYVTTLGEMKIISNHKIADVADITIKYIENKSISLHELTHGTVYDVKELYFVNMDDKIKKISPLEIISEWFKYRVRCKQENYKHSIGKIEKKINAPKINNEEKNIKLRKQIEEIEIKQDKIEEIIINEIIEINKAFQ
jgi:DNA gyrase/topoisomerase IV subunit A